MSQEVAKEESPKERIVYQLLINNDFANAIYLDTEEEALARMNGYIEKVKKASTMEVTILQRTPYQTSFSFGSRGEYHSSIWIRPIRLNELNNAWKHLMSE